MWKYIFDNMMCVKKKTAEAYACKSHLEGVLIGAIAGMAAGITVGTMIDSESVSKIKNKIMCIGSKCCKKQSKKNMYIPED
ncbi:MAG: hypothetical protein IJZ90_02955 [Clostridia bacterium]|nr:hypothetical protein [Clostridia bacterium]